MSIALLALMNAQALEEQRIQQAVQAIVAAAPITQLGLLQVQTATPLDLVDSISVVTDPQGLGLGAFPASSIWTSTPAAPTSMSPSGLPLPDPSLGVLGWANFVRSAGAGATLACSPTYIFPGSTGSGDGQIDTVYAYVFVRATVATTVALVGATSDTVYDSVALIPGSGWRLVRLAAALPINATAGGSWEPEALELTATNTGGGGGDYVDMTAVTLCDDSYGFYVDPQMPFSGDLPDEPAHAYRWTGQPVPHTAAGCSSNRYNQSYDLLAVAEGLAGISLAPLDLTEATRQAYLVQRFRARHQPSAGAPHAGAPTSWVTGFVQQIGDLIRTEDPSYDDANTNVQVDARWRSFTVSIYFAPQPALVTRLIELIETFSPYHLNAGGYPFSQVLNYGTFIVGISKVGDHL